MARPEVETAVQLGAVDPVPLWPDLASRPTSTFDRRGGRRDRGESGGERCDACAPVGVGWGRCGDDAGSCSASCPRPAVLGMARRRKARPVASARWCWPHTQPWPDGRRREAVEVLHEEEASGGDRVVSGGGWPPMVTSVAYGSTQEAVRQ
uniref:Uncharacterized protein n=1 Tax=Oryza rufipogon TaxID=4529 RepID=A0A0E0Q9E6_ORYRU